MPLEEEVRKLLISGPTIVIFIFALFLIYFWIKYKTYRMAYIWIFQHLAFMYGTWYFFVKGISEDIDYNHPMASETITQSIFFSFLFWVIGMINLLIAVFIIVKKRNHKYVNSWFCKLINNYYRFFLMNTTPNMTTINDIGSVWMLLTGVNNPNKKIKHPRKLMRSPFSSFLLIFQFFFNLNSNYTSTYRYLYSFLQKNEQ